MTWLLTPATVSLAVPLYRQLKLLKKNLPAIFAGLLAGILSGLGAIFGLCILFGLDNQLSVSLLPKSITVAIGSILSVAYLVWYHFRNRRKENLRSEEIPDPGGKMLGHLLKLAIPITLSSCTLSIVNLIDTGLVSGQLQAVFTEIQNGLLTVDNSVLNIFPKAVEIFQKQHGLSADGIAGNQTLYHLSHHESTWWNSIS